MSKKLCYSFILLTFFATLEVYSQNKKTTLYNNLSVLYTETIDNTDIAAIVKKYNLSEFKRETNLKIYKKLKDKTLWFHFKNDSSYKENTYKYLTVVNSYLAYGKVYLKRGNKIDSLYQISSNKHFPHHNVFYRHPVWKIPQDSLEKIDVFLKIKNSSGRTRLEMHLETENEFLKRVETEYFYFGLFIAFLVSMTLVLVFFAILKKEYAILLYALYIITVLFEFLAGKGLGVQYLWSDSSFMINSIRSFSQTIGVFCIGLFYLNFYNLNASLKIPRAIFKWGSFLTVPLIIVYIYKLFFGGLPSFFLTVWIILKIIALTWVLNHLYLTIRKQLPVYLVIAFVLAILGAIIGQFINPSVYNHTAIKLSGSNIYYFTLSIEIVVFTRFIFSSVIDTQRKYHKLKKANDELKYNFQNEALEIQQKERNKLVNNVHDTFGGYLEALKLRLLQKSDNTPEKIQEILDAFYKEYRYLLNSLYAPKINASNFIDSLVEYCNKLNDLTKQKINCQFNIENIDLNQEKCVHLYRIISELTTNAIKYSGASEISISMNKNSNEILHLNVSDDGIGFDTKNISNNGFGLHSVHERITQMRGMLAVSSDKKGTVFTIEIPIND